MPVNNASQQSLISLVDAFRDVAIPKNGGKKQYLVAGNGNKNHEIDGVSHENTKRIFTSDKNYGWRDAVNVLNGKRNTHYATARAALQKLIAGALREGVLKDQDQYKAVFELERLLKKSVSSGRVKIDETAQKNLGTVLDAIETAGKRAAKEGVQKDCRVVDGKAVHFFAEIQQRQTSSEHIPHPYDSAKKFGNAAVWTRIGSLNTQAKKIKNPATVERLKLRQSFSLSKKSSSAGSVNLLHKLEDWPGPVFQDTLRQFFEAADRQNSDGLKEASKRLLGCMNEARSFLTLTRDVLYSEAFINSIADNEDREKLKMLCGTAIRLLANIDDPDSPFARLKNLAVVADRSPDETCKELAAERRALLVPAVPAPDPTPVIDQPDPLNAGPDLSIVPAPLDNPPPPAHVLVQPSGSGQPPANGNGNVPQPLVANPASGSNSLPPDQPAPLNSIPANGVGSDGNEAPADVVSGEEDFGTTTLGGVSLLPRGAWFEEEPGGVPSICPTRLVTKAPDGKGLLAGFVALPGDTAPFPGTALIGAACTVVLVAGL